MEHLKKALNNCKKSLSKLSKKCYTTLVKIASLKKNQSIEKEVKNMPTVFDVSNWFLSKTPMTHKKLQKLCYYAQAWHCALYEGEKLFDDRVEAWVHGPVIPSLYPKFADYGWNEIPSVASCYPFNAKAIDILEAVYNTYSEFTGDQLETLTHNEAPWKEARGDLKPWEASNKEITCEAMRKYYAQKYQESQND